MDVRRFLLFVFVVFSPAFLGFAVVIWGLAINILIVDELSERLYNAAFIAGLAALPAAVSYLCFWLCSRAGSWWRRALFIYVCWLAFGFGLAYVFSAAMAGVSMAVVEGVVSGWELEVQILSFAAYLLLFGHVVILPAVGLSCWFMKANPDHFFGN
jgi:hypothetical protein